MRRPPDTIGLDPAGAKPWGAAAICFIRAGSLWWIDHPGAMTRAQLTDYLAALPWGGGAGVWQLAGHEPDARPAPGTFGALGAAPLSETPLRAIRRRPFTCAPFARHPGNPCLPR